MRLTLCAFVIFQENITYLQPSGLFSFFLIWGGTRSLRMPALRPASQAGPMRNPSEGTSVVLRVGNGTRYSYIYNGRPTVQRYVSLTVCSQPL